MKAAYQGSSWVSRETLLELKRRQALAVLGDRWVLKANKAATDDGSFAEFIARQELRMAGSKST